MSKVAVDFVSGETLPDVKPGSLRGVLIVTGNDDGRHYCYAAYYLNQYPLEYDEPPADAMHNEDGAVLTTGWYYDESNFEYDNCYHPISKTVVAWANLPAADTVLAAMTAKGTNND